MSKLYVLDSRGSTGDPKDIRFFKHPLEKDFDHFRKSVLMAEKIGREGGDFDVVMAGLNYHPVYQDQCVWLDTTSLAAELCSEDLDSTKDVTILDNVRVYDGYGKPRTIVASIAQQGYIPDLYVRYSGNDDDLYNDGVFINNVMKRLREIGYVGKNFGRAELGMQDENMAVLEPGDEFDKWVTEKYGWVNLDPDTSY
ncbi:MAG TPA: hypothetical protein DGH68_01790 [Bacteroidetes bacterium]|jgi:hypothetical protein|nr:hypothetical protein [Bacteroidota bacterium]